MRKSKAAIGPQDLPTREQVLSMSGLEFLQAVRDGEIFGPPMARVMNMSISLVEKGRLVFDGTPKFEHSNPLGVVHGGWYGAFLDSCMGCAVMTMVPKGSIYTTLEYKINILRPIPKNTQVQAIGISQHSGRSTSIANCEVRSMDGKTHYTTGSTTCIIMKIA